MSEIQDLLNASTQDMVDDYLIIDDNSREIYVPLGELLFGVTNDEKTERKYFQCPRIVGDNVDLTQYQLYINYQNANGEKDKYIVTDVKVVDDNITFTWLLSRKVTEYQGNISFIVCARNVDSLGNITNEWNTAIATGTCVVGLEVDDLTPGEQEQARDYFLQLEQGLSALAETENNRLLTTSSNQITNITNKGSEQVQLVENKAKKALDSIPSTYTDLQKQVNEVEDRELKDANGITQELTITDGYAQLTDTATKRLDSLVIKGNTVQNSTKGLNLINCTPKTTTINGITMVNNGDGTYTVNGTATDDFDIALAPYTTKQNIYYTLSGCPSGGSKTTYYLDPRGYEYDTGRGTTIINPNQDSSNYIRIVIKKDVTVNNLLFKPMFNEGQTAQPFEPYTGGKPSPNPEYPQEIKAVNKLSGVLCGKNLFNYNTYIKNNKQLKIIIKGGKTLFRNNSISSGLNYKIYDINNNILGTFISLNFTATAPLKLPANASYIEIKSDNPFRNLYIGYSSNTTYEPYIGSILNYTLQNPLYKIGDVYDYIDFNRGKIVRNIGVITFDGSDDENWTIYGNNTNMSGYTINISNAIDTTPCICNKLLTTDAISTALKEAIKVLNNAMYVVLNKIRGLNTTELFKSWLQSNPITVYYQLSTPTEEDIPTELLTQLKQLQTYSGETNISFEASDVYPTIDLEYIKDTKKYIESKEELDNQSIIDIDYRVTCLELDMEEQ